MSRNTVEVKVVVSKNGPYLVTGTVPLARQTIVSDAQGGSEEWQESDPFPPQGELRTVPLWSLQDQALLRRHPHEG